MDIPADIAKGILSCRNLVELFFGGRLVVDTKETNLAQPSGIVTLLGQDPRRIRYEIVLANPNNAVVGTCYVGRQFDSTTRVAEHYAIQPGDSIVIVRDFQTDGEGVCLQVMVWNDSGDVNVSARETFLTPAPVDEVV